MKRSFAGFAGRVVVVHTLTYILASVGILHLLEMGAEFSELTEDLFRGGDSPWLFAAPFVQPLRGLIIAFVLWPIWDPLVTRVTGLLKLWLLLIGIAVIGSPVVGLGSIEGFLRLEIDPFAHFLLLPELLLQTLGFAIVLTLWDRWALKRELAAGRDDRPGAVNGGSRFGLVAAMGYVGVAIGGFLIIVASPAMSFAELNADPSLQLFNVALVVVNFILARIFAVHLLVPERRRSGLFSSASLAVLIVFLAFNAGGAALYDELVGAPMSSGLVLSVYAVSSLLLWISAVTLLPGVKTARELSKGAKSDPRGEKGGDGGRPGDSGGRGDSGHHGDSGDPDSPGASGGLPEELERIND